MLQIFSLLSILRKIELDMTTIDEILYLAHKYNVEALETKCCLYLESHIKIDAKFRVYHILKLVSSYGSVINSLSTFVVCSHCFELTTFLLNRVRSY